MPILVEDYIHYKQYPLAEHNAQAMEKVVDPPSPLFA